MRSGATRLSLSPQLLLETVNALMVKQDGHAAWGNEDGDPGSHDQGPRMIDLEAITTDQLHGEGVKGLALSQAVQGVVEVLGSHSALPPPAQSALLPSSTSYPHGRDKVG